MIENPYIESFQPVILANGEMVILGFGSDQYVYEYNRSHGKWVRWCDANPFEFSLMMNEETMLASEPVSEVAAPETMPAEVAAPSEEPAPATVPETMPESAPAEVAAPSEEPAPAAGESDPNTGVEGPM